MLLSKCIQFPAINLKFLNVLYYYTRLNHRRKWKVLHKFAPIYLLMVQERRITEKESTSFWKTREEKTIWTSQTSNISEKCGQIYLFFFFTTILSLLLAFTCIHAFTLNIEEHFFCYFICVIAHLKIIVDTWP